MRTKIIWKILGAEIFLILVAIFVLNFSVTSRIEKYYEEKISDKLTSNLMLVRNILEKDLTGKRYDVINSKTEELSELLNLRISVIDKSGKVVYDSETVSDLMENHVDREEIVTAYEEGVGESTRYSETLKFYMKYIAVPVIENGIEQGFIRVAVPLVDIRKELGIIRRFFVLGGVMAILITLVIGYFISRKISLPFRNMNDMARSIAEGDLTKRVKIKTNNELEELADSFNLMADKLEHKISNLKKMDKIRTDFVANVSHELKTPLTSIQGFIETLEDGAINDKKNAKKFLEIIKKHTKRINNIVNDLLALTEIEHLEGKVEQAEFDIRYLLDEVVSEFNNVVSLKKQTLNVDYRGDDFFLRGDKEQVAQIFINLIDNAVKYTGTQGQIKVSIFDVGANLVATIEDNGIGIPKEHLIRVFERFYRVDKARSREVGGTGLGLAIVKHIMKLQKGDIQIDSEVGKGTKITMIFPK
ncbi:MAG: HAMP domain-containing protein [Candidatus Omnitrophica bacterium]|nr:HAMP domain-containing protein [Candidatus Omnitrophota bacterium]